MSVKRRVAAVGAAVFSLGCAAAAAAHDIDGPFAGWEGPADAASPGAAPKGKVVVYRGATLIDGTGAPARADATVVVDGDRIVLVGSSKDPVPAGAQVVDARGLYVLPGLIDTHVHLATPPDPPKAEAELRRLLYSGVTAVRDMADDTRSVAELQRRARVGEIPGPDIYFTALMAGPSFFDDPRTIAVSQGDTPGKVPWMQAITADTDLPLAVAMARGTYATAIKIYANLPAERVKAITAEAHRQGFPVWAHAAVFPAGPKDVVDARVDVVSHACPIGYLVSPHIPQSYQDPTPIDLKALGEGENPAVAALYEQMKAQGTILDATVRVYVEHEAEWAKTRKGRPPRCPSEVVYRLTAQAYAHGVQISAGTDGETDASDPYPALHEELELLSDKVGMPPSEVIRSATQVAARAAGREADMGVIAPGKLANLVFVSKDPLADVSNLRSVAFTVKRGKVFPRADYSPPAPSSK
ncbi:amidohydrolase family protein [Caulobacter sp. 17J65-9]|uniref:amidohydrolase family protein n=1 Tax=Caulobacter sp. 17J65-9 TaxID=2709382 RepID=UPI001969C96E